MAPKIITGLALTVCIVAASARHAPLKWIHNHNKYQEPEKRHDLPQPRAVHHHRPQHHGSSATSVLTYITPSPGATPIAVTKESQLVASYVPEFTLCELPPIAFYNVTRPPTTARPTGGAKGSAAPYQNWTISESIPPGNGTCTTIYTPTMTQVCATTLTALAEKYTVTNCHQDITFSAQYGAVLVTPTPSVSPSSMPSFPNNTAVVGTQSNMTLPMGTGVVRRAANAASSATITPGPSIATLTTYYIAPWQQLTAGTAPSDVDLKVCRTFSQNDTTECILEYQVWSTSLVTKTATSVTSVNISTTIHGRSQLIVETFVANVTELLTTFSMSTTMEMEFQTQFTTTHSAPRYLSTSTGPTVYETLTVQQASQTAVPTSSNDTTSTTTIRTTSTSTSFVGTVYTTLSPGQLPPTAAPSSSSMMADVPGMLGLGARWLREHLV